MSTRPGRDSAGKVPVEGLDLPAVCPTNLSGEVDQTAHLLEPPGAPYAPIDVPVPLVFEVWDLVEHFGMYGPPNVEQLFKARSRVGRNQGPDLLWCLSSEWLLDPDVAAAHVGVVWSMAEYPDSYLDHDDWRTLFEMAGYTRNGVRVDRPAEPLTLYRGSVPERRADWSWTDRLEVATGYAEGTRARRPTGTVWQAVVDPWRLLARNEGPDSRDEAEYVVDTEGLVIVEHRPSQHDGGVALQMCRRTAEAASLTLGGGL